MALPISEGETLFGDFTVTLAFDNDPAVPVKPLVTVAWLCQHCQVAGREFVDMEDHARTHFFEVASRAGE